MSLEEEILRELTLKPNLPAREIASMLKTEKKQINSLIYRGLKGQVVKVCKFLCIKGEMFFLDMSNTEDGLVFNYRFK